MVEPEIEGRPVFAGAVGVTGAGPATAVVARDVAEAEPPTFAAVTTTRIALPTSLPMSVYVGELAPLMLAQADPTG
jgi:hypothetical protein